MPYNIAGITFLAFGNGAPDVFSSIASFTGSSEIPGSIGMGALLGAGVFVTTVVVGSLALVAPLKLTASHFIRDIIFYLLSISLVTVATMKREITWHFPTLMFGLYFIYVTVVIMEWYRNNSTLKSFQSSVLLHEPILKSMENVNDSFSRWLPVSLTSPEMTSDQLNIDCNIKTVSMTDTSYQPSIDSMSNPSSTSLKHTVVSDNPHTIDLCNIHNINISDQKNLNHNINNEMKSSNQHPSREDGHTYSQSMELSESVMIHEYFNLDRLNSNKHSANDLNSKSNHQDDDVVDVTYPSSFSSLSNSLLPTDSFRSVRKRWNPLAEYYWRLWRLHKRVDRWPWFNEEWNELNILWRVIAVLEAPLVFCRDLTIPSVEEDQWSKLHILFHPILCPLLILFAIGEITAFVGYIPIAVLIMMIGIIFSLIIFFTTHHSRPPSNFLYRFILLFLGFIMCIVWIYIIAGELVTCLDAIGTLISIPPSILGLTVLAWGNSIGDFFSNISIAKKGFGEMAISGCYGGPTFNLMIGLGFSFSFLSAHNDTSSHYLLVDSSTLISLSFLYFILLFSICFVSCHGYRIEHSFGYILLSLYFVYTVVQALNLFIFNDK